MRRQVGQKLEVAFDDAPLVCGNCHLPVEYLVFLVPCCHGVCKQCSSTLFCARCGKRALSSAPTAIQAHRDASTATSAAALPPFASNSSISLRLGSRSPRPLRSRSPSPQHHHSRSRPFRSRFPSPQHHHSRSWPRASPPPPLPPPPRASSPSPPSPPPPRLLRRRSRSRSPPWSSPSRVRRVVVTRDQSPSSATTHLQSGQFNCRSRSRSPSRSHRRRSTTPSPSARRIVVGSSLSSPDTRQPNRSRTRSRSPPRTSSALLFRNRSRSPPRSTSYHQRERPPSPLTLNAQLRARMSRRSPSPPSLDRLRSRLSVPSPPPDPSSPPSISPREIISRARHVINSATGNSDQRIYCGVGMKVVQTLLRYPAGVPASRFLAAFSDSARQQLNYDRLGFRSLLALLRCLDRLVEIDRSSRRSEGGVIRLASHLVRPSGASPPGRLSLHVSPSPPPSPRARHRTSLSSHPQDAKSRATVFLQSIAPPASPTPPQSTLHTPTSKRKMHTPRRVSLSDPPASPPPLPTSTSSLQSPLPEAPSLHMPPPPPLTASSLPSNPSIDDAKLKPSFELGLPTMTTAEPQPPVRSQQVPAPPISLPVTSLALVDDNLSMESSTFDAAITALRRLKPEPGLPRRPPRPNHPVS